MDRRGFLGKVALLAVLPAIVVRGEPRHVRLARGLGWKNCRFAPHGNASGYGGVDRPVWIGDPPSGGVVNATIPRYDLHGAALESWCDSINDECRERYASGAGDTRHSAKYGVRAAPTRYRTPSGEWLTWEPRYARERV